MVSGSFSKLATVTASTKRGGGIGVDGLEVAYTENIATLQCLPLCPWDKRVGGSVEVKQGMERLSFREILFTFVEGGLDIKEGDLLVVSGTEYPIRAVADWYWPASAADYVVLTLEDKKP